MPEQESIQPEGSVDRFTERHYALQSDLLRLIKQFKLRKLADWKRRWGTKEDYRTDIEAQFSEPSRIFLRVYKRWHKQPSSYGGGYYAYKLRYDLYNEAGEKLEGNSSLTEADERYMLKYQDLFPILELETERSRLLESLHFVERKLTTVKAKFNV